MFRHCWPLPPPRSRRSKIAGAIYLVYLGISTLRSGDFDRTTVMAGTPALTWRRAWLQGLLSALLNPKLGVFFLTPLLPQFIAPGESPTARTMQLTLIFEGIGLTWLVIYTALLGAIGAALERPGPRRLMRWLTSSVLIALGARVALDPT